MRVNLTDTVFIACCFALAMSAGCSKEGRTVDGPPGFFVGVVTDMASGFPIDSAAIHIKLQPDTSAQDFASAFTYADGYYSMPAAHHKGRFYLFAHMSGYLPQMAEANLTGDSVKTDFELDSANVLK